MERIKKTITDNIYTKEELIKALKIKGVLVSVFHDITEDTITITTKE